MVGPEDELKPLVGFGPRVDFEGAVPLSGLRWSWVLHSKNGSPGVALLGARKGPRGVAAANPI